MAVILGEAIWGLLVSLTHSLVLPALARFMGGDPQSTLFLGKGDFDVSTIFSSILELCLAGVAALVLSYWSRPRTVRVRVKAVKRAPGAAKTSLTSISTKGMPSILAGPATSVAVTAGTAPVGPQAVPTTTPTVPPIPPATSQPAPLVAQTAASTKTADPAKPEKRKAVYYNIVGDPIYPTEDDN
jgi:hypothetical protein